MTKEEIGELSLSLLDNKRVLELMRRLTPEDRESLNVRRFIPPQGYMSPNSVEMTLVCQIKMMTEFRESFPQGSQANVFCMGCWQARHGWPMFAVTPELFEAMTLTDPPPDLTWAELQWPLSAVTFLFPDTALVRRYLNCPTGPPPAMAAGRIRKPPVNHPTTLDELLGRVRMPDGSYERDMLVLYYWDSLAQSAMFHDITAKPEWSLAYTMDPKSFRLEGPGDVPAEQLDFERMERSAKIAVNLLAFMSSTYEPEEILVTPTPHRPAKAKKGRDRDALYSVRWLGEGYKLKRPPVAVGGHHASPIWHWRKGHFRHQRVGPGRTQVKVVWIEPTCVGVEQLKGETR